MNILHYQNMHFLCDASSLFQRYRRRESQMIENDLGLRGGMGRIHIAVSGSAIKLHQGADRLT